MSGRPSNSVRRESNNFEDPATDPPFHGRERRSSSIAGGPPRFDEARRRLSREISVAAKELKQDQFHKLEEIEKKQKMLDFIKDLEEDEETVGEPSSAPTPQELGASKQRKKSIFDMFKSPKKK